MNEQNSGEKTSFGGDGDGSSRICKMGKMVKTSNLAHGETGWVNLGHNFSKYYLIYTYISIEYIISV